MNEVPFSGPATDRLPAEWITSHLTILAVSRTILTTHLHPLNYNFVQIIGLPEDLIHSIGRQNLSRNQRAEFNMEKNIRNGISKCCWVCIGDKVYELSKTVRTRLWIHFAPFVVQNAMSLTHIFVLSDTVILLRAGHHSLNTQRCKLNRWGNIEARTYNVFLDLLMQYK